MTRRAWLLLALVIAATGAAWWSRPTRWEHRFDAPSAKLVLFVGNSQT